MSELPALAKWKTTTCVIDVSLSHAMTEPEARDFLDGIADYVDVARAAISELEAALAERDRMLRLAAEDVLGNHVGYGAWLADLRARAEEAKP